jgi:hypothetical protein
MEFHWLYSLSLMNEVRFHRPSFRPLHKWLCQARKNVPVSQSLHLKAVPSSVYVIRQRRSRLNSRRESKVLIGNAGK